MKQGFPAGSTALFFLLLAGAAWLKGGGHLVDMLTGIQFTGTEADLGILSNWLGAEPAQYHRRHAGYWLDARNVFFGLSFLFICLWQWQRSRARKLGILRRQSPAFRRKLRRRR